jgi:hypothetical protein
VKKWSGLDSINSLRYFVVFSFFLLPSFSIFKQVPVSIVLMA